MIKREREYTDRYKIDLTVDLSDSTKQMLSEHHRERMNLLDDIRKVIMASAEEIIAKITANTDRLSAQADALDALKEGHADITSAIQALKDQIAAGETPDLTAVDEAVAQQSEVVQRIDDAVDANT